MKKLYKENICLNWIQINTLRFDLMITVYELIYNFLFIRKTIYHIVHYSKNNRFCFSLCSVCLSLLLPLVQYIANCCFFLAWLLNWENKLQLSLQASDLSIVVKAFYFQALISTFCKDKLFLSFYFQSPRKCLLGIFFSECYRLLLTIYFQIFMWKQMCFALYYI